MLGRWAGFNDVIPRAPWLRNGQLDLLGSSCKRNEENLLHIKNTNALIMTPGLQHPLSAFVERARNVWESWDTNDDFTLNNRIKILEALQLPRKGLKPRTLAAIKGILDFSADDDLSRTSSLAIALFFKFEELPASSAEKDIGSG